jgi:hypothetical protein
MITISGWVIVVLFSIMVIASIGFMLFEKFKIIRNIVCSKSNKVKGKDPVQRPKEMILT